MKFIRRMIAAVMVAAVCLTNLATTAFAAGKYLVGLSDDDVFELLWTDLDRGLSGLEASLMYDYCKIYVYNEFDMQGKESNYDSSDLYSDFMEWYKNETNGMEINTYNETVVNYLKEHPKASLRWTGSYNGSYTVYDLNILVYQGNHKDDEPLMQYDPENIDDLIIWTYDPDKEQFIGKDESGKLVKKVTAYSKPYGYRETTDTSKQEESSKTEVSEVETTSSDQESNQEEIVVSSAVEEQPESTVKVDSSAATDDKADTALSSAAEVVEESLAEEESDNDNSTTTIIIICGVVIVGVFAFLIIRQKKKKV